MKKKRKLIVNVVNVGIKMHEITRMMIQSVLKHKFKCYRECCNEGYDLKIEHIIEEEFDYYCIHYKCINCENPMTFLVDEYKEHESVLKAEKKEMTNEEAHKIWGDTQDPRQYNYDPYRGSQR